MEHQQQLWFWSPEGNIWLVHQLVANFFRLLLESLQVVKRVFLKKRFVFCLCVCLIAFYFWNRKPLTTAVGIKHRHWYKYVIVLRELNEKVCADF